MIRIRRDEPDCGNRRTTVFRRLDRHDGCPGARRGCANTKRASTARTCSRTSWASNAGNSRRDSIFANNPFLDGLFEWMDSPEGQKSIAIRDVLWDLLEHVQLDAKQRKLIWPDAERLDLEQSIRRVQKNMPGLSPRRDRGVLTRLDRHGLRSGKLFPGATRRARQAHRAMGRRPSPNGKDLEKTEENSLLLRFLYKA